MYIFLLNPIYLLYIYIYKSRFSGSVQHIISWRDRHDTWQVPTESWVLSHTWHILTNKTSIIVTTSRWWVKISAWKGVGEGHWRILEQVMHHQIPRDPPNLITQMEGTEPYITPSKGHSEEPGTWSTLQLCWLRGSSTGQRLWLPISQQLRLRRVSGWITMPQSPWYGWNRKFLNAGSPTIGKYYLSNTIFIRTFPCCFKS